MTSESLQLCTICGDYNNGKYLFEKSSNNFDSNCLRIYKCRKCKSIYLGKYNSNFEEDLYAYYDKSSDYTKDQVYSQLTKQSYIKVLGLLKAYGSGQTILDVGCGNGSFVDIAMENGYKVRGIDLSQSAINIGLKFNLPVENMDFLSSEIRNASFDVITMFEVIEHLPEPVKFLKKAELVVRPNGIVYLTTPNFNSIERRIFGKRWNIFHREHLTYFTPGTLRGAITDNTGFKILHVETRNISSELIAFFTHLLPASSSLNSSNMSGGLKSDTPQPDIRARISNSPWLSWLKRCANYFLNATGLGATIVIVLQRPHPRVTERSSPNQ